MKTKKTAAVPKGGKEGLFGTHIKKVPEILRAFGPHPSWAGCRRAAKVVVREWGATSTNRAIDWLTMFTRCLEVEAGAASDREHKRFLRVVDKEAALEKERGDTDALGVVARGLLRLGQGLKGINKEGWQP
jgi:hypothetical protein